MKLLLKYFLILIGSISTVLGVIGIFLPLIPTTPLLLLGSFCFLKSSEKLYSKLMYNKWLGKYIRDFQSGNGIPLKTKITVIAAMWISVGISILFFIPIVYVKLVMVVILVFITWYIASFKTIKDEKKRESHS